MADRIDWEGLGDQIAGALAAQGWPGTPARFALGMLMLKAMHDLSDEALWARWPCAPTSRTSPASSTSSTWCRTSARG